MPTNDAHGLLEGCRPMAAKYTAPRIRWLASLPFRAITTEGEQELRESVERVLCGLEELLAVAERIKDGDPSLDSEEWYAIRDYCRIIVKDAE
jgi:hypothetical protein